ncbi:MAG TPA: undecaprenyl-diphosphate phosphatase [Sedimentisphaerales bacterium]|jgi:undecaprenyl-diphosphatase|nr:undecaprenyl-diphosphate phosphatase [Sedimentisphaerales bacterium]HNU28426.1 undecaprenyl-diphosphate phosphatase [Sedimentisphaerales bacterium]
MIEWIAVIVLGLIEGITEFLPVSSTGHLLLAECAFKEWLGLPHRSDLFNTVIQCGAVLAVVVLFTHRVKQMLFEWRNPAVRRFLFKLAAAFLITGVGGVILKKKGLELPETAGPVAWATLIGGFVIFAVERWVKGRTPQEEMSWVSAIVVGLAQLLAAAFPGASRSGATILAAMAAGTSRKSATEFSFLLGIPTLLSAGVFQIVDAWQNAQAQGVEMTENWGQLAVAGIVAAVTAFVVVRWLLRFVQSHTFVGFGWYRIGLGLLILVVLR